MKTLYNLIYESKFGGFNLNYIRSMSPDQFKGADIKEKKRNYKKAVMDYVENTLNKFNVGSGISKITYMIDSKKVIKLEMDWPNDYIKQLANELKFYKENVYNNEDLSEYFARIYEFGPSFEEPLWVVSELVKPLTFYAEKDEYKTLIVDPPAFFALHKALEEFGFNNTLKDKYLYAVFTAAMQEYFNSIRRSQTHNLQSLKKDFINFAEKSSMEAFEKENVIEFKDEPMTVQEFYKKDSGTLLRVENDKLIIPSYIIDENFVKELTTEIRTRKFQNTKNSEKKDDLRYEQEVKVRNMLYDLEDISGKYKDKIKNMINRDLNSSRLDQFGKAPDGRIVILDYGLGNE